MPENLDNRLEQLEAALSALLARMGALERELRACRESAFALDQNLRQLKRSAPPSDIAQPAPQPAAAGAPAEPSLPSPEPAAPPAVQRFVDTFFKGTAPTPPKAFAAPSELSMVWQTAREWLFKLIGRPPEGENIEMLVGIYWSVRVGVLALAVALGMWGVYVSQSSGPVQRVMLGYALCAALLAGGWYYRRKVELFGRSLVSGGLAIGFFVSFGAHFLAPMHCLPIPVSALLSAAFLVAMVRIAERWQSPLVAGMSIFLGQAAAYVATREVGAEPLLAMLALAACALYLQLRHDWLHVSVFAVVSSYLTLAFWMFVPAAPQGRDALFAINLPYLTAIYGIFLSAQVLWLVRVPTPEKKVADAALETALGVLNALCYFVLGSALFMMTDRVEELHWFYFPLAAVQVALGVLEHRRVRRADAVYFALAVVLALLGAFSAWDGLERNAILYAFALVLLVASYRLEMGVFYFLAQGVLAVAFLDFVRYHIERPFVPRAYWGGLFGAAVLFTKSILEERRQPPLFLSETWEGLVAEANRAFSWGHAALGAGCIAYLSAARFAHTPEMRALAATALVVLAAALSLRARPVFWAAGGLLVWSHVRFAFMLPVAWQTLADIGPLWGWPWIAAATLLSAAVLAPRTLRYAWATLDSAESVYWSLIAVAALAFSTTVLARILGSNSLTLPVAAPMLAGGGALLLLAWEYNRMTHEHADPVIPLHAILARVVAAIGGWLLPLAFYNFLSLPHALVASTLCALLAGGEAYFVRPLACAAGVALLVALGQMYGPLGVFAAATDHPYAGLFLFVVGAGVLVVADRVVASRRGRWLYLPLLAVDFILYALLYQQAPRVVLYPSMALAALLLLWAGRALAAERFAKATIALLALAHFVFYLHGIQARLPGRDVFHLILPLLAAGLLTAAYERLRTRAWRWPGLPVGPGVLSPAARLLRHGLLLSLLALGMATTAYSDLLGPQLSAVGWTATAVLLLLWGFAFREGLYRRYGLGMFLLVIARIILVDTAHLDLPAKIIVYFVLGGCLIGIGVLYVQFRERLMKWLG